MSKGNGRVWAFSGFFLGTAVSVAGNVAHTWHPSDAQLQAAGLTRQTAEQWEPEIGAQLFAAFFPLALLLTVEVLSRASWPSGRGWALARYGGTSLVALVAAVASYRHLYSLLRAYGEDELNAIIGPLAVDGLMVVCGFALLAISRHKAAAESDVATADTTPAVAVNESDATRDADRDTTADVDAVMSRDMTADTDDADRDMSRDADADDATSEGDTTPVDGDTESGDMTPDNVTPLPVADEMSRDMTPVKRPRPRVVATDDHAERARALLAEDPDIKGAELGRRLGLSERQGQRLLASLRPVLQEVTS